MVAGLWIMVALFCAAFVTWRGHGSGWADANVIGMVVGGVVGVLVLGANLLSLRKALHKSGATALQMFMVTSFATKFVAAVGMAVFAGLVDGESGPVMDLEAALISFMSVVFLGFALQGILIEARSGASGADSNQAHGRAE